MLEEKYGIIVQARMGSTRLPGKVLLPFKKSNLILNLIDKLLLLNLPIIVATTRSKKDDQLVDNLSKNGITTFRGSETDVLSRFIEAGKEFRFEKIIRVCSDNPYLDIFFLESLLTISYENPACDYVSFSFKGKPTILSHFGVFAEIVGLKALEKVHQNFSFKKEFLEHVTLGVYQQPVLFKILFLPLMSDFTKFEGIRLTVDTMEDYRNLLFIEGQLKTNNETNFYTIANFILRNPFVLQSMQRSIELNKK